MPLKEIHSIGIGTIPEDECFLSLLLEYVCPLDHVKNLGVDMITRAVRERIQLHAQTRAFDR